MSDLLYSLGLKEEEVRAALGSRKPEAEKPEERHYLQADGQRRMRKRLKKYSGFIFARYLEGYNPKVIACMLCVSEESVRSRLRKNGFFGESGPGRPKTSDRIFPTRLCISPTSPLTR